jgi:hypothetical protein
VTDTVPDTTPDPAAPRRGPGAVPASPLLARPGAVPAEGRDAGVAWHYGDPTASSGCSRAGRGAVDLSHRGVVRVAGPDRLTWLHSMTTQQLAGLPPHTSTETLVLSPHGHVEHALHVVDDGEAAWLTVEPGTAPALVAWLDSMRFMLRVEVADVTADWAVLGEPVARESEPGEPLAWRDPWPALGAGSASYAAVPSGPPGAGRAWREVLVPRAELAGVAPSRPGRHLGGGRAAGGRLAAAARLRDRPPDDPARGRLAADRRPPAEGLLPRAGDGRPRAQPRAPAAAAGAAAPRRVRARAARAGSGCFDGERRVGFVTTPARHHEDGPIALALVKRSTPVGAQLLADGVDAAPGGYRRAVTRPPAKTMITVAPTGAEVSKADWPVLRRRSTSWSRRPGCEAAGASMIHVHIRDDDAPADPRPRPPARDRGRAAVGDVARRPALDRRQRARPAGRALASSTPSPTRAR